METGNLPEQEKHPAWSGWDAFFIYEPEGNRL